MANLLFVSKQAISKWENERGMPDISLYPKLAEILDVSIDELMGKETKDNKRQSLEKGKTKVIFGLIVTLLIVFVCIITINLPKIISKNRIKNETEQYLGITLPIIESYQIIEYNEWLNFNNTIYPNNMYYFTFYNGIDIFDDTWMVNLPQDMIDKIPIGASEYPYICDYYKLVDTTINKYNYITIGDDAKHEYILYCYQIQNKRLIAIKFEV